MKGAQTELNVIVCEDAEDATKKGFVYTAGDYKGVHIDKFVVVKNGMESGSPTVDLVMSDDEDKKTVCMIPLRLLAVAVKPFDPTEPKNMMGDPSATQH